MLNLRGRLLEHIDEVLDPDSSAGEQTRKNSGGWGWILQKSAAFLTRQRSQPNSESDAALKARLTDLHKDIKKQIEVEVRIYRCIFLPAASPFANLGTSCELYIKQS